MANVFVNKLDNDAAKQGDHLAYRLDPQLKEKNANKIAVYFVLGYFLFLFSILAIGYFRQWEVDSFKEIFIATTALLSSPLSFILGYFFKNEINNKLSD